MEADAGDDPTAGPANPLRVLVVEDDTDARDLMVALLEPVASELVACHDGAEAFEAAKHTTFDVAVIDLMLPDVPGEDVAATLRARWPELRVVIMTGMPAQAIPPQLMSSVDAVLEKPFPRDALLAAVAV